MKHNVYIILNANEPSNTNKARITKAGRKRAKKIERDHRSFFCAKIHVKTSTNGMEELHKQTKAWFDKI